MQSEEDQEAWRKGASGVRGRSLVALRNAEPCRVELTVPRAVYSPHFSHKEAEIQQGEAAGPKSQSKLIAEAGRGHMSWFSTSDLC